MSATATIGGANAAVPGGLTPEEQVELAWQLRQSDPATARVLVEAAEPLLPPEAHAARARLQLVQAESCWLMADLPGCHALAEAADAGFARAADAPGRSDAAVLRAHAAFDAGDFDRARVWMADALERARSGDDAGRALRVQAVLAYWSLIGDTAEAERTWGAFVATHQDGADPWLATWAHDFQGQVHARRGRQSEAITAFSETCVLALQSGQLRRAIVACTNVAASFSNLNAHEPALEWIDKGLQLARPGGWPASLGLCLMMLGNSHCLMERYDAARQALEEAVAVMRPLRGSRSLLSAQLYMCDVLLRTGDAPASAAFAVSALADAQRAGLRDIECDCQRALAEALVPQGRYDEARVAAERALRMAEDQGAGNRRIDALRVLAQVHAGSARDAQGHQASTRCLMLALEVGDGMQGFVHAPETVELAARAHADAGDFAQAVRLMRRANALRDSEGTASALDRAIAMELHHATTRASAEAAALRERAAAEALRSQLLQASNATLRQLGELGQDLTVQVEPDPIYLRLHQHLGVLLDAPHLSIWLLDEPAGVLRLRFGADRGQRFSAPEIALNAPDSDVARCVREGQPRLQTARRRSGHDPAAPACPPWSALHGPLRVRGRVMGALSVGSPRAGAYGERERLLLRSVCAWTAIAVDNVAVVSQLDDMRQRLQDAIHAERLARRLAEQATRLKSEFLANISHDLRTPLASLQGYLETLLLEPSPISATDRARYLDAALAQSAKVNRLADELMVLGQLESGQKHPTLRAFALPELLVDVVRKLELSAVARSQRLLLRVCKPLPAALADHGMIDRVLTNLLDNAIQHTPCGSQIRVELERDQGQLAVTVLDTGPGIAADLRRDLFIRPSAVAKRHRPRGGGLGLLIVQRLLQQHGCEIRIIERAGFGAAFRFNVPAVPAR